MDSIHQETTMTYPWHFDRNENFEKSERVMDGKSHLILADSFHRVKNNWTSHLSFEYSPFFSRKTFSYIFRFSKTAARSHIEFFIDTFVVRESSDTRRFATRTPCHYVAFEADE